MRTLGGRLAGHLAHGIMRAAGKRCLTILIYHRVRDDADDIFPGEVDHPTFSWQMEVLSASFTVLPLDAALTAMADGELPARSVAVTFDDGYRDNYEVALPILQRCGVPATFFIATGFLDGGIMWNDVVIESIRSAARGVLDLNDIGLQSHELSDATSRRSAIESIIGRLKYLPWRERAQQAERIAARAGVRRLPRLMMTSEQVRSMHEAGMGIGAHTVNHPILARTPMDEAAAEIGDSKARLEAILGTPVTLFAYPNGKPGTDYKQEHPELVQRMNFAAAVSTAPGVARGDCDRYQLPRFTPWDRTPARFVARLVHNSFRRCAQAL